MPDNKECSHMEEVAVILVLMKKYSNRWRQNVRDNTHRDDAAFEDADTDTSSADDNKTDADERKVAEERQRTTDDDSPGVHGAAYFSNLAFTIVCLRKGFKNWKVATFEHHECDVTEGKAPEVTVDTGVADEVHVSTNSRRTQTEFGEVVWTVVNVMRFIHSLKKNYSSTRKKHPDIDHCAESTPALSSHVSMYKRNGNVNKLEPGGNTEEGNKSNAEKLFDGNNTNGPGSLQIKPTNDEHYFTSFFRVLVLVMYNCIHVLQRSTANRCDPNEIDISENSIMNTETRTTSKKKRTVDVASTKHVQPDSRRDVQDIIGETDRPPPIISVEQCSNTSMVSDLSLRVFSSEIQEFAARPERPNRFTCVLCRRKIARVVFLPCCHLVTCVHCASGQERCPVCAERINKWIEIENPDAFKLQ